MTEITVQSTKGVDGPERPGLVLGKLEARKLTGLVDRCVESNAAAGLLVEDLRFTLDERSLEEHLERVLKVEKHDGGSAVVVRAVEGGHRRAHEDSALPCNVLAVALMLTMLHHGC